MTRKIISSLKLYGGHLGWIQPVATFVLIFAVAIAISVIREQDIHWAGLLAMVFFYALMYGVGLMAASLKGSHLEDMIVAGRSMPLWIGAFSMAATWVDGGYINGTAEYTYSTGLVWAQAPWCYALSLMLGGIFFARKMRRQQFMTMLDPLERRYGQKLTACLYLTSLFGDIFWSAAILTALGTTFGTILGMDFITSILLSAAISIAYTRAGGMWAVAFTNVLQVVIIVIGLAVVVFFVTPEVGGLSRAIETYQQGMGDKAAIFPPFAGWKDPAWGNAYWNWWDMALLLILGGIPWQGYFQRVLSAKNENTAAGLSLLAGAVCLSVAIPAALIGVVGYNVRWTDFGTTAPENPAMILPYVLRYMTPPVIAALGLGAVAAAVMSSVASSVLASSSMAAWNIYRPLVKPTASREELEKVVRVAILFIGIAATIVGLKVQSVYALWYLCSDFVYCILFPQLTTALFFKRANRYGAAAGLVTSFILRMGGGESMLGIPAIIPYPMIENGVVLFPFRTLAMTSGLLMIIVVSLLTQRSCPPQPLERAKDAELESSSVGPMEN
ncbi:sodium:solute symporter family protein [Acidobacteria bacterium AH-259-G07]|nr:sodium:solute symporter family protein [Acidobacteria bacterium AH-259-G07]